MNHHIRTLSGEDLDDVVRIHMSALPDDVLPSLGKEILLNYYKNVLADDTKWLYGIILDKRVVGFCQLSVGRTGLARMFCNFRFVVSLVRLIVCRPRIFYSLLRQTMNSVPLEGDTAEISFIAIAPTCQGAGYGKALLYHAKQYCKDRGIESVQTKTANQKLRMFYVREYLAKELYGFEVGAKKYSILKWKIDRISA